MGWFSPRTVETKDDTHRYWSDARYDGMGQGKRAWTAKRDGWRLSPSDEMEAAEHEAGFVRGHHFLVWNDEVVRLKREQRYGEALELLLEIITATEAEQAVQRQNAPRRAKYLGTRVIVVRETPPAWTEHAAIIYRKLGDLESEIAIIDRWEAHAGPTDRWVGATQPKLLERREKARALLAKCGGQTRM